MLRQFLQKVEKTEWTRLKRIVTGQTDKYSYIWQLNSGFCRK